MPIWRKILYYIIGVVMGIFIVQFLFGWRDDIQCSYFPNDRVLYDMRSKKLMYSNEALKKMEDAGIDSTDILMMLNVGNVDFDRSQTDMEDSCKTYNIEHTPDEGRAFSAMLLNCDSTLKLMTIDPRF